MNKYISKQASSMSGTYCSFNQQWPEKFIPTYWRSWGPLWTSVSWISQWSSWASSSCSSRLALRAGLPFQASPCDASITSTITRFTWKKQDIQSSSLTLSSGWHFFYGSPKHCGNSVIESWTWLEKQGYFKQLKPPNLLVFSFRKACKTLFTSAFGQSRKQNLGLLREPVERSFSLRCSYWD